MRIGIIEISPSGHSTLVESLIKIYSSAPNNQIYLFCNDDCLKMLKGNNLHNTTVVKNSSDESLELFFEKINSFKLDKGFFVTIEPVSKKTNEIAKLVANFSFNFSIYFFIHNLDAWFKQPLFSRVQNIFINTRTFQDLKFNIKVQLLYPFSNSGIIKKILQKKGKLVVLSEPLRDELAKYVEPDKIEVIPFSVFDENSNLKFQNPKSGIRVCIPGFLSTVRRDYFSVLKMLESDERLKQNIELDLLGGVNVNEGGNDVKEFVIDALKSGCNLLWYDKNVVGISEFDVNLSKADVILCNLNLNINKTSIYGKTKESGIPFTMIKAAKPGIFPINYKVDAALESSVLRFNNYSEVAKLLIDLIENPEKLKTLKENALINSQKYTPLSVYKRLEEDNKK